MTDEKEGTSGRMTVLSIDGGGIRGVIPAMVLEELERRTRLATSEMFDLIVGTSTGGILALGLVTPNEEKKPRKASELVRLYEQDGARIFSRSRPHLLSSAAGVLDSKYPARGLASILKDFFGDSHLCDALTNVLVTGYDLEAREPLYFSNTIEPTFRDLKMRDIARATSAAPTYFPPVRLEVACQDPKVDDRRILAIDGGVFANNPSALAYAEARQLADPGAEILVVSLGTGSKARSLDKPRLGWGLAGWSTQIIDVLFEADTEAVHKAMEHMLQPRSQRGRQSYYRFQASLEQADERLDKATVENLANLRGTAGRLIKKKAQQIAEVARELSHAAGVRRKLDRELSAYRKYRGLPPGRNRTARQRKAAEGIADLAAESGYSGQRLLRLKGSDELSGAVVLVALMKKNPDPRYFEEVLKHVEAPPDLGQRLQFDALEALLAMVPLLSRANLEKAKLAIRNQEYIKPENEGRWQVAQEVLKAIPERVSVIEETPSGRNLRFRDNDTRKEMTQAEFVRKIEKGEYKNYHVRKTKGVKTPVSNPGTGELNNLD